MTDTRSGGETLSIGETERRTGLPKDTLRIWERRYGFPTPVRGAGSVRSYPIDQVEKLRIVKILVDRGGRPAQLLSRPWDELEAMVGAPPPPGGQALSGVGAFLANGNAEALRRWLLQSVMRNGLERFVLDTVAPAAILVGQAWAEGELAVYAEHMFTEQVTRVLRSAIEDVPQPAGGERPRVLLTTLPGEPHTLGLLMAEALMVLEGAACLSLGAETPPEDIAAAARVHRCDIVALSVSGIAPPDQVLRDLRTVCGLLPADIQLWCGGAGAARLEAGPWTSLGRLPEIATTIGAWRQAQRA